MQSSLVQFEGTMPVSNSLFVLYLKKNIGVQEIVNNA